MSMLILKKYFKRRKENLRMISLYLENIIRD